MEEALISKLKETVKSKNGECFSPASQGSLLDAEAALGFPLPSLLKAVLAEVGNGGFGPGKGGTLIGVSGGYESDFGTLVDTYRQLVGDQEIEGKKWQDALLPFCEWGCNIFSCVDCSTLGHPVYVFEDFATSPTNYSIEKFFELWINGVDILSYDGDAFDSRDIRNPFGDEDARAWSKRRKT